MDQLWPVHIMEYYTAMKLSASTYNYGWIYKYVIKWKKLDTIYVCIYLYIKYKNGQNSCTVTIQNGGYPLGG